MDIDSQILEHRKKVIEIIEKNNINELENYVNEQNLTLSKLNKNDFDILIHVIENNISNDTIKYIIKKTEYHTYNYHITINDKVKIPLFSALAKDNFEIAQHLIELKADLNYYNNIIIKYLKNLKSLNKKNLKFILNHGYHVKNIKSDDIISLIMNNDKDILDVIFRHYIFDNDFIINLLKIYHHKEPLTNSQLNNIILKEKNKILIRDEYYQKVHIKDNTAIIKTLFENDNKDRDIIIHKIKRYDILEKAIRINDCQFVKEVFKFKEKINWKSFNYEENFVIANNFNNLEIIKLLIDSSLSSFPRKKIENSDSTSTIKCDPQYFNFLLNILITLKNFESVKYLMENNKSDINLNSSDINGVYPIFNAYNSERRDIFNYLLNFDFDYNIKNNNVSLLSLAISKNEYLLVKYLLKHNVIINEADINGNYPLMKAIYQNAIDVVISLVDYGNEHGINMNVTDINGNTPLTLSYRLNYLDIFRYLVGYLDINMKDSTGNNILYYATEKRDIETITKLIHHKIDIFSTNKFNISPLDYAINHDKTILLLLLENSNNNRIACNVPNSKYEIILIKIIKIKNYSLEEKENIISILISKGTNINYIDSKKETPLIYAIKEKSLSIVKMLVKNGANVNYSISSDSSSKSVLKYAINSNQLEIVKFLVQCNANINSEYLFKDSHKEIDKIDTPIFEYLILKMNIKYITGMMIYKIIKINNLNILKKLIERKLDINIKDSDGDSPLAIAIYYKRVSIVEFLIECKGIDFNNKNIFGETISDYNENFFGNDNSYEEIYNKIKEHIKDSSSSTNSNTSTNNL